MIANLPLLAVTGLLAEARIAAGAGVMTLAGGGDAARLALLLQAALARGAKAVISFGIAGGLAPGLRPGTTVIARSVKDGPAHLTCDDAWVKALVAALPHAVLAELVGVDRAVSGVGAKAALHEATGAVAVDMESHVVGRLAARHGVPFAALRIISDPADRSLPLAATAGLRADGSTDVGAVLRVLARHPRELPALIRTAIDARTAFAALTSDRRRLCSLLGFGQSPTERGLFGLPLVLEAEGLSTLSGSGVEVPHKSA